MQTKLAIENGIVSLLVVSDTISSLRTTNTPEKAGNEEVAVDIT